MASADWTLISDVASSGDIKRGVTAGITPPPSGVSNVFTYGMASQTNTPGTVALYSSLGGFAPLTKGGEVRAAMLRKGSAGTTLYAPFIFLGLNGTGSTNLAYILGLSDSEPSHITLRKGTLAGGVPDAIVGSQGVLARSSFTVAKDTWTHLRLEVVNNPGGDVVLNCYQSDLSAHNVDSPSWVAIPGLGQIIDDALGINTGSAPLIGGRVGFGMVSSDVGRVVAFDQCITIAQN